MRQSTLLRTHLNEKARFYCTLEALKELQQALDFEVFEGRPALQLVMGTGIKLAA